MSEFQHISLIKHLPVVGETYKVNCVKLAWNIAGNPIDGIWKDEYIPIIHNRSHEDYKALGQFAHHHYHFDFRFLSDRFLEQLGSKKSNTLNGFFFSILPEKVVIGRPQIKEFKCLRQMPDFPDDVNAISLVEKIHKHYPNDLNVKKDCLRCPHRGTPLNGIEAKNNVLTCPAHGLRFNAVTGRQLNVYEQG